MAESKKHTTPGQKTATKEAKKSNQPSSMGYSVKLSSADTTKPQPSPQKTNTSTQQALGKIDPKKMTPAELAKAKAEFVKRLQSDPQARAQVQQMAKDQFKKLPLKEKVKKFALFFSMQKIQNVIVGALKSVDNLINFIVKNKEKDRDEVLQSARPAILFGMWIAVITFCIFGVWAGIAPLDSASSGMGIVVVDSSRKIIQHKEGGIVEQIFVKDGDNVTKGQELVKLSNASLKPQLDTHLNREIYYRAILARLKAEKSRSNQINFSQDLIEKIQSPEINKIIMNQQSQFESRRDHLNGKLSGLDQKIEQTKQQIIALKAQKISTATQLELTKEQVDVLRGLYEKGLAQKPRLIEQQSREASLIAHMSEIESKIMGSKQSITELKIEKENFKNQFQSEINHEMSDVTEKLNETKETINSINEQFDRLVITSPIDGIVSKVQINTIGGVIPPGSQVMTIIPMNDNLVIDAFVRPQDIDSVYVGLTAKVRISAFKSRSTGPLDGVVVHVSPDLTEPSETDKVYNMIFQQLQGPAYKVRIKVDKEQLKKISKYRDYDLYPGMQADVMIVTGERTLLQYLLDPVTSTFWHAFTEK